MLRKRIGCEPIMEEETKPDNLKSLSTKSVSIRILIAYILYSIVSHNLAPYPPYGGNASNAQLFVYYAAGYALFFFAIFIILAGLFFLFSSGMRKRKETTTQNALNSALVVTLIFLTFLIYSSWNVNQLIEAENQTEVKFNSFFDDKKQSGNKKQSELQDDSFFSSKKQMGENIPPVITSVTVQDSESASEEDFNLELLENIEQWLIQTMLSKGRQYFVEKGYDPKDYKPKLIPSSVLNVVSGKKLGIIKINMENTMRSVTILGFINKDFYRITCLRKSNHDIPVYHGECGRKVKEVFKIDFPE